MSQYSRYPVPFGPLPIYPSAAFLPANEVDGFTAIAADTDTIYAYNAGTLTWVAVATPGASIAITALTGDVTATGPGVAPATISNNAVTNAKLADMANNTVKGNKAGSTGDPQDLALSDVVETGSAVLTITNGTKSVVQASNLSIQVSQSTTSTSGYLSSTDWNTFNNKQSTLTLGNLTDVGTDGIVITGGTGAVVGAGTSIAQHVADATHNGYLSSTDFVTFNAKQPAGNYITALTGDATASGPGSAALTLATVNSNVGTFGSATQVAVVTANAKGLTTAASSVSIAIPASQVTDFNEAAQDAVGGILVDTATIDLVYNDGAPSITANVIPGGITHSTLAGLTTGDAGHTQFALLAGRSGGQTLNGDTAAAGNLALISTANATKGNVFLNLASDTLGVWVSAQNNLIVGEDFLQIADIVLNRATDIAGAVRIGMGILSTVSDSIGGGSYYAMAIQPSITGTINLATGVGALFGLTCDTSGTGGDLTGCSLTADYGGSGTLDTLIALRAVAEASNNGITNFIASTFIEEPSYNEGNKRQGLIMSGTWGCLRDGMADSGNIDALDVVKSYVELTTAAVVLRGIANGYNGKRVLIEFANGATITNESGSASAANRITTATGANIVITGLGFAEFVYNDNAQRWRCIFATA